MVDGIFHQQPYPPVRPSRVRTGLRSSNLNDIIQSRQAREYVLLTGRAIQCIASFKRRLMLIRETMLSSKHIPYCPLTALNQAGNAARATFNFAANQSSRRSRKSGSV